ncbi:MAG: mevalonate kinase [Saprospiraceae bacterium]
MNQSSIPSRSVIPALNARNFSAKLLLFGEHVLLLGASALAVPVAAFGGQWAWSEQRDRHHQRLLQFAQSEALESLEIIDTERFASELKDGLLFHSNIPTGYGLGSSGALCAAIYERFASGKTEDLTELKSIFARMESFFHGNSSGIDPLTSYVATPILIQNKTEVTRVSPQNWETNKPTVFLLDSQLPRRTGPLVEWFLEQNQEPVFAQKLSREYLPAHEHVIRAWLSANAELFWPNLRLISAFQFENFAPMIPKTLHSFWENSLDRQDFVLKICGAGGGGFVLGFARNIETAQTLSKEFQIVFP